MKKGNKSYAGRTRLICYEPVTTDGKNFYLCKWDVQSSSWEKNGGGKSIKKLHPLIDGNRYNLFVSQETKRILLEVSTSNKFSLLVRKLSLID